MSETVLYIGSFVNDDVRENYDIDEFSIAGNNKTENIVKALEQQGKSVVLLSPLFANKTDFSYYPGKRLYDKELDAEILVPPHIGIFGLNFFTVLITSIAYAFLIARKESTKFTMFYNYRLQRMLPALIASYYTSLILQYEDGHLHSSRNGEESTAIRILRNIERKFKPTVDKQVDGAICTNTHLAQISPTENTVVLRGVPSVGLPDEIPKPQKNGNDIVVMFASKLDWARGIDRFLEATRQIDGEDVQFWISGYGELVDEIEDEVAALDDDRVEFFGTLPWDKYKQRISDSDVLVNFQNPALPVSEFEFPSKLLDFMSARSVIVSTDMSDIRSCFADKVVLTSRDSDIETLETVIGRLRDDPSAYDEQIAEAERWVKTQTEAATVEKIQQVFDAASK